MRLRRGCYDLGGVRFTCATISFTEQDKHKGYRTSQSHSDRRNQMHKRDQGTCTILQVLSPLAKAALKSGSPLPAWLAMSAPVMLHRQQEKLEEVIDKRTLLPKPMETAPSSALCCRWKRVSMSGLGTVNSTTCDKQSTTVVPDIRIKVFSRSSNHTSSMAQGNQKHTVLGCVSTHFLPSKYFAA
jgi:hypothetical protein